LGFFGCFFGGGYLIKEKKCCKKGHGWDNRPTLVRKQDFRQWRSGLVREKKPSGREKSTPKFRGENDRCQEKSEPKGASPTTATKILSQQVGQWTPHGRVPGGRAGH